MSESRITQGFQWEFGQRKGLFGLPDIEVVIITGQEFGNDVATIRKGAMAHLNDIRHREATDGIKNSDTGWDLTVSKVGYRKMARDLAQFTESLQAIFELEKLSQRAVLAESHKDTEHNNPDVQAVHRMFAPVEINGRLYRVKLTVRDYFGIASGERTNLHAIEAIEIEKPGDAIHTFPLQANETWTPTEFTVSLADLLAKSTRHGGLAWDFSDTGVRATTGPEPGPRTRAIATVRPADSMTGLRAGLERLIAPFEPKKLQKSQKTQLQHEPEPEPDSGPDFGMG